MLSRAKFLDKLWVLQTFGHHLFARGPPLGPHLLLRKLHGEISRAEAIAEFAQQVPEGKAKAQKNPLSWKFSCAVCELSGRKDHLKSPAAFEVYSAEGIVDGIISHGAWARCAACRRAADAIRERW